jgi:hypothetical protein
MQHRMSYLQKGLCWKFNHTFHKHKWDKYVILMKTVNKEGKLLQIQRLGDEHLKLVDSSHNEKGFWAGKK